jgi:hypothetical protein
MTRPSTARPSSVGWRSASQARPVTAKTSPRRSDAVSSGPNKRNVFGFLLMMSRTNVPRARGGSVEA